MLAPPTLLDSRIASLEGELLGFLRKRVGAENEEVAQDVWMKVAAANPECGTDGEFRAFVYVVARRLIIDRYRKRRIELVPLEGGPEPSVPASADSTVAAGNLATVVEGVLEKMKPEQTEVFWLRTRDHVAFKDIAERQGCSVNTALGRMHQVVKRLKAALAAEGWT